jgi:hypothetical protein
VNRDFRDLLAEFNVQGVEYLVVGAHALAAHGHVRATKDLDVWVRPDAENAKRVLKALRGSLRPTDLPTYRRSLKIQGSETIITACLQRMSFTMP